MRAGRKVRLWGLRVRDAGRLPCEARAPALLFPLALNRVTIRNGHLLIRVRVWSVFNTRIAVCKFVRVSSLG